MDEVVETEGVKLLIDPKASLFLIGTEMDYVEEKLKSGFVFRNPEREGPLRLRRILPRLIGSWITSRGWGCRRRSICEPASLDRAYFALQRQWHPDRFVAKPAAERARASTEAAALNDAYRTLKDPLSRAVYLPS